jgi:chemotaxis protein MotB
MRGNSILHAALLLALLAAPIGSVQAQSPHPDVAADENGLAADETIASDENDVADIEQLIATIEARVQALGDAGDQRDQSLEFLTKQVEQAIGDITVQDDEKVGLKRQNADLNWQVETLNESRGALKQELREVTDQHDSSVASLEAKLADLSQLLSVETEAKAELLSANDDLLQQLEAVKKDHTSLGRVSSEQKQEIVQLNEKVAALQTDLTDLSGALAASKQRLAKKERDIASLQERLESALATPAEQLSRYRSEFFARLRTALGEDPDLRVEGERFVVQSEVLFAPVSAELGEAGKRRLAQLARNLHIVSRNIPSEIDWVLQVGGHTDRRPVAGADYPSNWELSTARALAVVRFLIRQGVPPYRLAATGYGEFQPLERGDDEIAYRRNRRVEFALTEK